MQKRDAQIWSYITKKLIIKYEENLPEKLEIVKTGEVIYNRE